MRGKHFTCTMKRLAGVLLFMAAVLLPVGQVFAAYNVNISGDPSANGAWSETLPVPEVSPSVWTWTPNGNVSNVSVVDILTKLNVGGV
ncbi:MAG: hypothetical protein H7Y05_14170, partial [Steroidobacteraceae bacterium]|nr:hypothetical protein [Deltaproteobacteria bacterium]